MILADFAGTLGRHGHGRGRGFHRVRPGSYYPVAYPTAEYVAPIALTPVFCSTRPNPIPACAGGRLVWRDANTVCCVPDR
jgi:hypothetical protein